MSPKALLIIYTIVFSLLIWFIASILNTYVWYIFIFMLVIGLALWKWYDILAKKNWINKKSLHFIYTSLTLAIITVNISINYFDYKEAEKFFNIESTWEINAGIEASEEFINIIEEQNIEVIKSSIDEILTKLDSQNQTIYQKEYDTILATYNSNNKAIVDFYENLSIDLWDNDDKEALIFFTPIINASNEISKQNYQEAIPYIRDYYTSIKQFSTESENIDILLDWLDMVEDSFILAESANPFTTFLKNEYWAWWQIWFFIFSVLNSGQIETNWLNEVDTGYIWSIFIYLLDCAALGYWFFLSLSILNVMICKQHEKAFEPFWKIYQFPTESVDFNGKTLEQIIEKINTKPEKKWIFTKSTNYVSITFTKCPECSQTGSDSIINIKFSHFWTSKAKPLTWVKIYNMLVSGDDFEKISTTIDDKSEIDISK